MNNNCVRKKVLIQIRDLRIGNGIAACIMNYFEYTIQNGISIDFLLNRDLDSPYKNIVLKNGSRLFVMPHDTSKPNKENVEYIKKIISGEYDVLHVNTSGYYALKALKIAKNNGIKTRIFTLTIPKNLFLLKLLLEIKSMLNLVCDMLIDLLHAQLKQEIQFSKVRDSQLFITQWILLNTNSMQRKEKFCAMNCI